MVAERQSLDRQREAVKEPPESEVPARASWADEIQTWQRYAGNRAVSSFLTRAQPSMRVGAANDPSEHEADVVAEEVVEVLRSKRLAPTDASRKAGARVARGVQRRAPIGLEGGDLDADTEA